MQMTIRYYSVFYTIEFVSRIATCSTDFLLFTFHPTTGKRFSFFTIAKFALQSVCKVVTHANMNTKIEINHLSRKMQKTI